MPNPAEPRTADPHRQPAPFLKWAGGKRQLLPEILRRVPALITGTYFEPFLGGGAVFFALIAQGRLHHAVLCDVNADLIGTYQAVRDRVDEVIEALRDHQNEAAYFYRIRSTPPESLSLAERGARLIYLNRCGYNGLYRVNASGKFNVPFGRNPNATICDEKGLRAASDALQVAELRIEDFATALGEARQGDFVYCDPPYVPLSATSSFTSYTRGGFTLEDQKRLRDLALELKRGRVPVLLSNSSAPCVVDLYSTGFRRTEVDVRRSVNCQPGGRGTVSELLIE